MSYTPPTLNQAPPPPWLRGDHISQEDIQPLNTNSNSNGQPLTTSSFSSAEILSKAPWIHLGLRVITILLCLLMTTTAIIGIEYVNGVDASGKLFVGAYMLFFSFLLLIFELNGFRKVESIDHFYRRNFGFIYGVLGKALFIIFIAFLSFGLGDPETLTMITGLSLTSFGVLQVGLYLKYPEMFENSPINGNIQTGSAI